PGSCVLNRRSRTAWAWACRFADPLSRGTTVDSQPRPAPKAARYFNSYCRPTSPDRANSQCRFRPPKLCPDAEPIPFALLRRSSPTPAGAPNLGIGGANQRDRWVNLRTMELFAFDDLV